MYEIEEFYEDCGEDLKSILKSCVYNYFCTYKVNSNNTEEEE